MKKIKLLIALLAFCLGAMSQPVPSLVYCTLGDFPEEIYWEIQTCETNNILASGYAGDSMWVVVPDAYNVWMTDNYGDGWNGAYLHIGPDSIGFLSDVDWIDSIGTWPQTYTELMYDILCINLSTGTGASITSMEPVEYIFEPIEYFDLSGRKVIPDATGIYIASDGYIRKLIYITK
tara:strand:- start:2366 stop:2896 length:531 start_codon:yes stop_codon:yes gene_type:complete